MEGATGATTGEGGEDARLVSDPILSREQVVRLYCGVVVLAVLLAIVDVTGVFGWSVSTAAVGLVGLIAVLPFADQIRKVKIGAFEAELAARMERMEHRVSDISESVTDPGNDSPDVGLFTLGALDVKVDMPASMPERVVWVDDDPDGNRLEIAELQKRFDVITATDTANGLIEVNKSPHTTLVITDAVRKEDSVLNTHAGVDLIDELGNRFPHVPVYVYCGPESLELQGDELAARSRLATTSWTALARQIRSDARAAFELTVADVLRLEADEVEAQTAGGIDFVAALGEQRVGVEVKDWRRPPNASAFDTTATALRQWLEAGTVDRAVLVTPRDVLPPNRVEQLPDGVEAVVPSGLATALRPPAAD